VYTNKSAQAATAQLIQDIPVTLDEFRCHLCSRVFIKYDDLRRHYGEEHQSESAPIIVTLNLNGKQCETLVEPHWTLQRTLQFRMGLTGTKHMCDKGVCGSCTVIMDGETALACTTLAIECEGKLIQTVEGVATDPKWKPLVDAYCRWDAMQCGYCTPGFLVTAKAFIDKNPNPTEQECREALSGNICICGTYPRHFTAIIEAALKIAEGGKASG